MSSLFYRGGVVFFLVLMAICVGFYVVDGRLSDLIGAVLSGAVVVACGAGLCADRDR